MPFEALLTWYCPLEALRWLGNGRTNARPWFQLREFLCTANPYRARSMPKLVARVEWCDAVLSSVGIATRTYVRLTERSVGGFRASAVSPSFHSKAIGTFKSFTSETCMLLATKDTSTVHSMSTIRSLSPSCKKSVYSACRWHHPRFLSPL